MSDIAVQVKQREMKLSGLKTRGLSQHIDIYNAELERLWINISHAAQLLTGHPFTLHVLADNFAAVCDPIHSCPSPSQSHCPAIRTLLSIFALDSPRSSSDCALGALAHGC